jgi:hypothetical protein
MPDFLAGELTRQRLDLLERAAEEGARRHRLLRALSEAHRTRSGRGSGREQRS